MLVKYDRGMALSRSESGLFVRFQRKMENLLLSRQLFKEFGKPIGTKIDVFYDDETKELIIEPSATGALRILSTGNGSSIISSKGFTTGFGLEGLEYKMYEVKIGKRLDISKETLITINLSKEFEPPVEEAEEIEEIEEL